MSRKIIGPSVLDERIAYMNTKSIWFYIEIINQGLQINQVEPDGRINIIVKYNVDSNLIQQIVDMYENAGWAEVNVALTGTDNSLYGTTEFEFVPPVISTKLLKKKIRKNL